jgi:signal peptidase I
LVENTDKASANKLVDGGGRKVWLAALMAIIFPGMGQLYNGQTILALIIILAIVASHVLVIIPSHNLPMILMIINVGIYLIAILYAILRARRFRENYVVKLTNNWIFYMVVLMIGIILTNLPGQLLYEFHRVEADCMSDIYNHGDVLYVNRTGYWFEEPRDEDIVLYRNVRLGGKASIGRVWAEGEKDIDIKNDAIYLNGNRILTTGTPPVAAPEVGAADSGMVAREKIRTINIPKDNYLIIGDNSFGWADAACSDIVPRQLIDGKVDYIFYKNEGTEENPRGAWKLLFYNLFFR